MKRLSIKRTNLNFDSIPEELINSIHNLFYSTESKGILSKDIEIANDTIRFNNYRYRVGNKSKGNRYKVFCDVEADTEFFKFEDVQMLIKFHSEHSYYGFEISKKEYIKIEFSGFSQLVKNHNFKYIVTPQREIMSNNCDYLINPTFLFELNDENKKNIKLFLKEANKYKKKYRFKQY